MPVVTIHGTPHVFNLGFLIGPSTQASTFAIPSDLVSINSATWYAIHDTGGDTPTVTTNTHQVILDPIDSVTLSAALTFEQKADVLAAKGALITAVYDVGSIPVDHITDFYIVLDYVSGATPPAPTPGGGTSGAVTGFKYVWRRTQPRPTPSCIGVLVGKSTQIYAGNPLVLTNSANYTGVGANNALVARPLTSVDTISNQNGLIGVALFDVQTDSNGWVVNNVGPVSVDQYGKVLRSGFSNDLPRDPVTGFIRMPIAAFDDENIFAAWTAANEVASFYDVGRTVGITASSAMLFPLDLQVAAGSACLMIDGVESEDAKFNDATGGGLVYVRCLPTFYAKNIPNGFFTT